MMANMTQKQRQGPETLESDGKNKPVGNARFSTSNRKNAQNAKDKQREANRPRRVTRDYLMNYATWYLERFAASRARLEKLMRGKIRLSAAEYGTDPEEAENWMKSVLAACEQAGFINDDAYAKGRARSLFRKGKAMRVIAADLSSRGIASDQIDTALKDLKAEAEQAAYDEARHDALPISPTLPPLPPMPVVAALARGDVLISAMKNAKKIWPPSPDRDLAMTPPPASSTATLMN